MPERRPETSIFPVRALAAIFAIAAACSDAAVQGPLGSVTGRSTDAADTRAGGQAGCIRLAVPDSILVVGETTTVQVVRNDAAVRGLTRARQPTILSRDTTVASVSSNKTVRAVSPGVTYLVAALLSCTDSARLLTLEPTNNSGPTGQARHFFVDPAGSPQGNGTRSKPWDLATALKQPTLVVPGDTIWMLRGTYVGDFQSNLSGTALKPLILRQWPGDRATIDGSITINGHHAWYWGIEVMSSDPKRVSSMPGPWPSDLPRQSRAVIVNGSFVKLIHMAIHDLGNGVFSGASGEGLEIFGCLIFNNGWQGLDRSHGHNLYLQNSGAAKKITDNAIFHSFGHGLQIYGTSAASLMNFEVEGNAFFGSGEPVGANASIIQYGASAGRLGGFRYRNNSIYHRNGAGTVFRFGVGGGPPGFDLEFTGNIVQGKTEFAEWQNYTVQANTFTTGGVGGRLVELYLSPSQPLAAHRWEGNRYYSIAGADAELFAVKSTIPGSGFSGSFGRWVSNGGYDKTGTFVGRGATGTEIQFRPSQYERGRALVTVWNWSGASVVTISPGTVLALGESFEIHSVLDPWGEPVVKGIYRGGGIAIPLTSIEPTRPIGWAAPVVGPDPTLSVFVLRSTY